MKFKIGDKVRRISSSQSIELFGEEGGVYTVTNVNKTTRPTIILKELSGGGALAECFVLHIEPITLPEELFVL